MIGSLLLVLLVLATITVTGLLVAKQASRRRKLTGPVCGHCDYRVTGLTTLTCPECGGDLRAVGIVTSSTPTGQSVVAGVMIFTVLLGFIATVATSGVISVLPVRHSYKRQVRLGPVSSGYPNVLVQASRTSWGGSFVPAAVTIELEPGGAKSTASPAQMIVHADGKYEFTSAGSRVVSNDEFGESAVLEWLKAAGIDTTAADMQRKAARIAAEARIAARSGRAAMSQSSGSGSSMSSSSGGDPADVFQNISTSQSNESHPPVAPSIAIPFFWLAVWIWGLWYLVIRGTRRRRVATMVAIQAAAT
jgi:hypothetical protein